MYTLAWRVNICLKRVVVVEQMFIIGKITCKIVRNFVFFSDVYISTTLLIFLYSYESP